jgi:DNA protecting protein DprA
LATTELHASALLPGNRLDELTATAALMRASVVPMQKLGSIIDSVGSAVKLVQMSEDDRIFVPKTSSHDVVGAVTARDLGVARRDVEEWLTGSFDIRSVLDESYPDTLHDIFNRPPLLFVRGHWTDAVPRPIAIVGARDASTEGLQSARRFSEQLVEKGFTIVSGLAKGIDTSAHQAALDAGGFTSAVLGTGLKHIFPAENQQLADEILARGGALISQFFPHQPPARWTFPMRNVVMSGISLATIVIEAGETSGARLQARVALQHGRTVFLLRSLVEKHQWARKYVENGAYGTTAIPVETTAEIVERLEGTTGDQQALSVA